jgi:hypothetical protein
VSPESDCITETGFDAVSLIISKEGGSLLAPEAQRPESGKQFNVKTGMSL